MGCFGSKDRLSKEDMDFLKSHTRYDEATIKEWYKGFKVINYIRTSHERNFSYYPKGSPSKLQTFFHLRE